MTTSELLTMMTGGMAHVSGAVMLAYVTMGAPLKYLITASVMAAPGTFLIAKILWPETENPVTMGTVKMQVEKTERQLHRRDGDRRHTGDDARPEHLGDADRVRRPDRDAQRLPRLGRPLLRQPGILAPDGLRLGAWARWRILLGAPKQDAAHRREPHREQDGDQRVLRLLDDEGRRRAALRRRASSSRRSRSAASRTSPRSASRSAASAASRRRASPTSRGSGSGRFSPARSSAS